MRPSTQPHRPLAPFPPIVRGSLIFSSATALLLVVAWCVTGCAPEPKATATVAPPAVAKTVTNLTYLKSEAIGATADGPPWIAHVLAVDLDQDGLMDLVICESRENKLCWLRQKSRGVFEEKVLAESLRAPVHVEAADLNGDGATDLIVGSMGEVFPNNDRIGVVYLLENDGHQKFTRHVAIENTSRITDVRIADLNADGKLDLVLAQFGYDQGEVSWLERTGPWEFRRHVLLELSGAINVGVADFDGDGHPDVVALLSQQWEEVYYFKNDGHGAFTTKRVWGSTNEDYGSSGLTVCDLNRDGRPDVVFSNGDGFGPASTPGPRPWHGLQWLENVGSGQFRYHRIGNLPGAYSPIGLDLDGDGAMDVVAVGAYADWNNKNRTAIALMWFRNDGAMNFEPRILANGPKDQITLAVGDFDGNGRPVLATGGFYIYPPYDAMGRVTLWRRNTP